MDLSVREFRALRDIAGAAGHPLRRIWPMLRSRPLLAALVLALVGGALALASPQPARAAAFTVTKVSDTNDGVCDASDCSLREAIIAANTSPGADVITVPSGTYVLTLTGDGEENAASGDLDITDDVTINGVAARQTIIDGNAADRVFDVKQNVVAEINTVTIQGGKALNGGGIRNNGTLTLNDVTVTANTAGDSSTANGGGVLNVGTFTAVASRISGNDTTGSGAGIDNTGSATLSGSSVIGNVAAINGGGINNISGGTLTIESGSRIETNTANSAATGGGGILAGNGTVTITDSTLRGNTAVTSGGAINVGGNGIVSLTDSTVNANTASDGGAIDVGGEVTITTSTLNGNQASDDGGALFIGNGTVTVLNSTLSNNSAGDLGGAVLNGSGTASFTHVTMADNSASNSSGTGAGGGGGGIRHQSANGLDLRNTIVANSSAGGDCAGTRTPNSLGNNLDSDESCSLTAAGDLPGQNPTLGPLQDNGGPTFTHALLAGSPAIDAAAAAFAPATDQRGIGRPAATPDIGAFERSLFDLIVTGQFEPIDPALRAATLLRFQTSNQGPDAATDVDLAVTLPDSVRFVSASPGCTQEGAAVVCELGTLAADAAVSVEINVTPLAEGSVTVSATATGIGEEQNPADNTAQATAQVQPATTTVVNVFEGWNLTGWYGPSTPVAEAAAGVGAQFDALFVFNPATQGFLSFRPALPQFSTIDRLEPGQGVWMHVTGFLDGRPQGAVWEQPAADLLPAVQWLAAGPNLVTWQGADGAAVLEAVAALGDALERLFLWDAAAQRFLSFDPTLPSALAHLNTAETLRFGDGVWMIMRRGASWSFGLPGDVPSQ